jgi:ATP-dependent Zn protease
LAATLQKDIHLINLSRIKSTKELFDIYYKSAPKKPIILIEDIDRIWDQIIINTNDRFDSEALDKKIGLDAVLTFVDMVINGGCVLSITSNQPIVNKALTRDGRFDIKIEMENCDFDQLSQIISHFSARRDEQRNKMVTKYCDILKKCPNRLQLFVLK